MSYSTRASKYIDFVKVPFLSEAQRQLILRKSYQTGMQDKIRIIFTTPRTLSWQFRSRQEHLHGISYIFLRDTSVLLHGFQNICSQVYIKNICH
jgi:hypothetical protein